MKAKFGTLLMILGAVLLVAALALFLHNAQEDIRAGNASAELMPQIVEAIYDRREEAAQQKAAAEETEEAIEETQQDAPVAADRKMSVVRIDGLNYLGFLGIPALELELPIMADWDNTSLQTAPCRYWGDMYTQDLVLMAHNYERHFGKISRLRQGDVVTVTDMDGVTMEYQVMAVEVLGPQAVEEMTAGEYDLTLFTCTYGGENRVTVRCDRTTG